MAYAAEVEWELVNYGGVDYTIIRVVETEAATDSEWDTAGDNTGVTVTSARSGKTAIAPLPQIGTICLLESKLADSGTGTEIQPTFTKSDNAAVDGVDLIAAAGEAAAFIHEQSPARFTFDPATSAADRAIYGKSNVDAGTDNPIETLLIIAHGMLV